MLHITLTIMLVSLCASQHSHCKTSMFYSMLTALLLSWCSTCKENCSGYSFSVALIDLPGHLFRKSCSTVHMHKNRFNFTFENTVDSRSLDICDDMSGNVVVLVKMLLPTNFKSLVLSFPWLSSLIGSGFCLVFHYVLQTRKFLERCHLIWSTHHMTTPGQTSSFSWAVWWAFSSVLFVIHQWKKWCWYYLNFNIF